MRGDAVPSGDLANDLVALSLLFRTAWSAVKNKTTVEQTECERADRLGRELLVEVGTRLQPSGETSTIDQAIDRRARAFTLLVRAYDLCRKAATYLRWEQGDADLLVPSLFQRARSKKGVVEAEPAPASAAPEATPGK